jgi:3-oxoacyl-[acyl-carrier-protein] synthase-3
MAGNEVFKHAVRRMESACKNCLDAAGVSETEVGWIVPHQANSRILDAIAKRFTHLPEDRIYRTVHKYGNTSASSVGIALDELLEGGAVGNKDYVLLTAFGGGFTWGALLLQQESQ